MVIGERNKANGENQGANQRNAEKKRGGNVRNPAGSFGNYGKNMRNQLEIAGGQGWAVTNQRGKAGNMENKSRNEGDQGGNFGRRMGMIHTKSRQG